VALSGLFLSLEDGGSQMLGLNNRRLLSPEHEGGYTKAVCEGFEIARECLMQAITTPQVSHQ
jgi:hypothetical protein